MTTYKIDFAHLTVIAVNKNGEENDINCGEACTNVEELIEFIAELTFDRGEFSWEVAAELIDSLHHTAVLAAHAGELALAEQLAVAAARGCCDDCGGCANLDVYEGIDGLLCGACAMERERRLQAAHDDEQRSYIEEMV